MRKRIIFFIRIAVVCFMCAGFGVGIHADEKLWVGEITFKVTGTGHKEESKHTDSVKLESSSDHSLNAGSRIRVCGGEGELNVIDVQDQGTEYWEKNMFRQENHTLCEDIWKRRSHIARPGDTERVKETFKGDVDPYKVAEPLRRDEFHDKIEYAYHESSSPRLEFTEDTHGSYSLYGSYELTMYGRYKNNGMYHYACDGKNVKKVFQTAPDMPVSANSDKEGNSFMSGPSVPVIREFKIHVDRIGAAGSQKIWERMDKEDNYAETAVAAWHFRETPTSCDCVAFVDMAKGDVQVDGKPIKNTILEDPGQISTGHKSRARLTLGNGAVLQIGSNNTIDIITLCRSKGTRPLTIKTKMERIFSILFWSRTVEVITAAPPSGVRGELLPYPRSFRSKVQRVFFTREAFASSTVSPDETERAEVIPDSKTLGRALAALLIKPHPARFSIWVLKGKLKVEDDSGSSATLQGNTHLIVGKLPPPSHFKAKWLKIKVAE